MLEYITADALAALAKVIMIDLVLAGDNAIVIGLAAAGLPQEQRARAIRTRERRRQPCCKNSSSACL